jgi:aldose 1-epimerase
LSTARSEAAALGEVVLARGGQRAAVLETGAALRSWSVDGEERLDTFGPGERADSFRGAVLAPWPNRVRDGRYVFRGVEHRLPITEPARGSALHGLVLWASWRVVERDAAGVTLAHALHPRPGYPFALALTVRYELTDGGLSVTLGATNTGNGPAPFGAGLHPYLRAPADGTVLSVPARTRVPVDADRLLPTGPPIPIAGTEHDFATPRRIGSLALDTCFGDLGRDADGIARVRLGATTVWMDRAFRFVHVYTADDVEDPARRRRGIAVEPLSCAPDAFNTGEGLEELQPGASLSARCGLAAT